MVPVGEAVLAPAAEVPGPVEEAVVPAREAAEEVVVPAREAVLAPAPEVVEAVPALVLVPGPGAVVEAALGEEEEEEEEEEVVVVVVVVVEEEVVVVEVVVVVMRPMDGTAPPEVRGRQRPKANRLLPNGRAHRCRSRSFRRAPECFCPRP